MIENEIKPVLRYELAVDGDGWNFGDAIPVGRAHPEGEWVTYRDYQYAIDYLSTQLKHYGMAAEAEASFADKRKQEIDRLRDDIAEYQANLTAESEERIRLESERDAAKADAAALRECMVELEKQRDDYLSREWKAERAKRQAVAERDASQLDAFRYRGMRDRLPWTITPSPIGLSLHFEIASTTAAARVREREGNGLDAAVDALLEALQE